jgi:hypothetical protein
MNFRFLQSLTERNGLDGHSTSNLGFSASKGATSGGGCCLPAQVYYMYLCAATQPSINHPPPPPHARAHTPGPLIWNAALAPLRHPDPPSS